MRTGRNADHFTLRNVTLPAHNLVLAGFNSSSCSVAAISRNMKYFYEQEVTVSYTLF